MTYRQMMNWLWPSYAMWFLGLYLQNAPLALTGVSLAFIGVIRHAWHGLFPK